MNSFIRNCIFITGLALLICFSCNSPSSSNKSIVYLNADSVAGDLIADTIIYDVIIKNRDKTDLWSNESIRKLKRSAFIDSVFTSVYDGKTNVYDFFSDKKLTIHEVKQLEKSEGFSRDNIGKIQFYELWYYNSNLVIMQKKVVCMVLGMEHYSESGEFRGYKPVFKMNLN